ncbi:MAG: rhomboid family intramembrane serine protease [Flavobacteriales bacterium MED-G15]|nr:MAG: rhomboid family intramembrane serine protease [Flavobacteriales bacterium MED-G15]|tara:strand:- start:12350 stop:13210 length:861 start_codon:yes stop_codon:yes gene_type:complete
MNTWDNLRYRLATFSIAEKLILINALCFVLPMLLNTVFFLLKIPSGAYMNWLQLSPNFETFITRPWTLISYSFIHSGFFHLLWNMLLLFYSGRLLLNLFPNRIFINNYFLGVITGGLVFILSYALFPVFKGTYPPMIGASAGVMAVFIFICTYTPEQEIRVLFFNVKLKYLGLVFFFLDVIQIPYGNAGGHLAHIGGAILGFFYARQLTNGRDIGSGFERVWKSLFFKKQLKTVYKAQGKPKSNKVKNDSVDRQKKIDTILDKISKSGYDSLSKDEKDFLFKSGKE